jgi:tetratricopeptide (TPR) repeat protein
MDTGVVFDFPSSPPCKGKRTPKLAGQRKIWQLSIEANRAGEASMGRRRPFGLAIAGVALALFALPAHADDWDGCNLKQDADPEVRISSCSAIIDAGTDTARNIAIAYYHRALAYNDKFTRKAILSTGYPFLSNEDYDWVIEDYDRAIALDPKFTEAYNNRGIAYSLKNDPDRAIKDYDRALALNPKLSLYVNRGKIHEKRGDTKKAIADYRKALELNPNNWVATEGLARLA